MADQQPPNKLMISKLSRERDGLMSDILKERTAISTLEAEYNKYQMEFEYLEGEVKEKEQIVLEYDRMINEGQKTFDKLEENSFKLIKALQEEERKIVGKYKKN